MWNDWEIEAFNERYEAFEKICGRVLFWVIVVVIIGGIVANMAMLTWMVKSYHEDIYRPGKAIAELQYELQKEIYNGEN
jgi:hypothetical protein